MNKTIFIVIVIQFLVISLLSYKIVKNRSQVLGTMQVAPINKKYIDIVSSTTFKYFYEPKANTVVDKLNDWTPYKAVYTINGDSLNERYDYSPTKPPRTFRIITLGDSFTYGLYVDTAFNWSEKLEEMLNNSEKCSNFDRYEVINLGVYGYDIQYSSERYNLRGKKYSPDLVLWLMKRDDYGQINEVMLEKERYYSKKLRETGEFDKLVKQGQMYPSWNKAMEETQNELGKDTIIDLQNHYLDEFSKFYTNPLVIMNFSFESSEVKDFYKNYSKRRKNTYLFDKLVNINENYDYHFPNDGHPTVEGHKVIAEDVYTYLNKNNIIPCE